MGNIKVNTQFELGQEVWFMDGSFPAKGNVMCINHHNGYYYAGDELNRHRLKYETYSYRVEIPNPIPAFYIDEIKTKDFEEGSIFATKEELRRNVFGETPIERESRIKSYPFDMHNIDKLEKLGAGFWAGGFADTWKWNDFKDISVENIDRIEEIMKPK